MNGEIRTVNPSNASNTNSSSNATQHTQAHLPPGVTITTVPITATNTNTTSYTPASSALTTSTIANALNNSNIASLASALHSSPNTITTVPALSTSGFNFNGISNPILAAAQAVSQKASTIPHIISPTPSVPITNAHANASLKRRPHQVCFFCEKRRLPCNEERPCAQCVKEGREKLCVNTNIPPSPTTSHLEKKSRTKGTEKRTAARKPLLSSPTELQQPAVAVASSIPPITFSNKIIPDFLKGKEINETTMYILNELFKMRMENQRMKEEIQALKTIPHTEEHQKAFVMFDLTKKTATVLTADYNFCKMLGYEMEEVLGAPWSKFVHPDYRERALNIFSSKSLTGSIELDQVYVHKNGAIVFATDVHTFLFGTNRNPVSDFVCVKLRTRLPSPASTYTEKTVKYHTTPAITYPDLMNGVSTAPSSTSTISQIPSPSPPPASPHPNVNINNAIPPSMAIPPTTAANMNDSANYDFDVQNSFLASDNSMHSSYVTSSPPPQYDDLASGMDAPYFSSLESMIDPMDPNSTVGTDVPMEEGSPVFDLGDDSLMNAISYSPLSDWNPNNSDHLS